MLKVNEPEISVNEIMQKIREEVRQNHDFSPSVSAKSGEGSDISAAIASQIEILLKDAESYSEVPSKFPDKFNRFPFNISKPLQKFLLKLHGFLFKKQRVVNFSLIYALRESLALNRRLTDRVNALQEQLSGMSDRFTATEQQLQAVDTHLTSAAQQRQDLVTRLTVTEQQLQAVSDRLAVRDEQVASIDRLLSTIDKRLTTLDERYTTNDCYLKHDLAQHKQTLALFLTEARQRLPEPFNQEQLETFVNEDEHSLDAFYVAFEAQFRGSRADIINRLKVYIPLIGEAKIGTEDAPVLDVGCGRGEWLELLRESGYIAKGLDINRVMIEQCRARGFDVIEGDVLDYLRSISDASLGAVTGFHIIEHLPFKMLMQLFDEVVRILKPGGMVIFETPNPGNVLVGSNTFYLDPTHRNPLPSSLIQFLAESRGLCQVKIMKVNPYPEHYRVKGADLAERFNDYFYGAQDYSVIGYKA
jgi:SAM-dependent methyltransferase